ncbi:hypothetical protein KGQ55_03130 [Patescibacteria group bacterium]|nr:hypothetical protein [Patescibacteria group bacterium]
MKYAPFVLSLLVLISPLLLPIAAHAAGSAFVPLAPVPNLTQNADPGNLALFFNNLYKFCIGIAAVLAILQIIHGGFMYMTTESVGNKTEGKNLIIMSLLGLLLVLLPYAVFSIINPSILDLSAFNKDVNSLQSGTPAAQTSAQTVGSQMVASVCSSYSNFSELPAGKSCSSLGGGWGAIEQNECCIGNATPVQGSTCCALDPNYKPPAPAQAFYTDKAQIPSGSWCYQVKDGYSCAASQSACQTTRASETDPTYVLSYCAQY